MAEHNDLGNWGEDKAADFLERKGYVILERDWRMGKRDLDIIALSENQDTLVFVEVKTRQEAELQLPEEAVDVFKMRNLAIAANAYVKLMDIDMEVRFDIISIVGSKSHVQRIEHIVDAFNPLLIL